MCVYVHIHMSVMGEASAMGSEYVKQQGCTTL